MGNKYFGKCALCGKEGKLTFEHIPPRKAFNWFPAKTLRSDEALKSITSQKLPWDFSDLHYNNLQKGSGSYTLCNECNNTGSWYGNDYVEFTHAIYKALIENKPSHRDVLQVDCSLYPLRILKQVSSMFCSVNQYNDSTVIQSLRQFVLNKTSMDFPSFAKIGMYCFIDGIAKNLGIFGVGYTTNSKNNLAVVSEIDHLPLGFVLFFNPDEQATIPGEEISSFRSYDYNQIVNIHLSLPCYETNTLYPLDYRTKNDIICARINDRFRRRKEANDPDLW